MASTLTEPDPSTQAKAPAPTPKPPMPQPKRGLLDRVEAFISRLSTRNNFWHRVCSLIWLPYAFRSGIKMKKLDDKTFTAVLPFKKFNRNWYNAMAGAALLGNSEIAGGMYVFGECGGDYTVVCRNLEYRFLRPCFGPAIYRINPKDDIKELLAGGGEFNVALHMDVIQQLPQTEKAEGSALPKLREKRVGRVKVQFHCAPKAHLKSKGRWSILGGSKDKQLPTKAESAMPDASADESGDASGPSPRAAGNDPA